MLSILVSNSPMMALEANLRWENMQFADCKLLTSLRCSSSLSVIRLVMGGCWLYRERCQHQADFFRLRLHSSRIIYVLDSAFDVSLFLWCKSLHSKKRYFSIFHLCTSSSISFVCSIEKCQLSSAKAYWAHSTLPPLQFSIKCDRNTQTQKYRNTELLNAEHNVFLFSYMCH